MGGTGEQEVSSMKIYLAARFERQAEMRDVARLLRAYGYVVTSRWLEVDGLRVGTDEAPFYAAQDVEDVAAAEVLILFTEPERVSRGGKDVEMGLAFGLGRTVYVCGPRVNIFHYLPAVRWFPTVVELIRSFGITEAAYV
jgi:hypothetical protein